MTSRWPWFKTKPTKYYNANYFSSLTSKVAQRQLLRLLLYARGAHTSHPRVLLARAECEPCGSLTCFLFPVKEELWAQGCILAITVVWGYSGLQGLTGDSHFLSHTTPACKTWKVKQMGGWRLHWSYRKESHRQTHELDSSQISRLY